MQSRNRLGCHRKYITGYSEIDGSDERKRATCTYIERHFGPRWQLRFSYSFTNRVRKKEQAAAQIHLAKHNRRTDEKMRGEWGRAKVFLMH